jgi:hypothetical protein
MGYTTLAAFKSFGGFEGDEEDALLHALIGSATSVIENYTQRKFDADEESTQDFSTVNGVKCRFSGSKLFFYTELADEASAITDTPTVSYLPEDGPPYYGIYNTDGVWASPTVTVTGYWGYSKTPPPDVEMACLRLSKWLYDLKDTSTGSAAIITPEGKVLLPQGLPTDVRQLLKPYKKVTSV